MSPSQAIRILLVDDHPAVRGGLASLFEGEEIVVCGEASGRAEALQILDTSHPDVALVDLSLSDGDGLLLVADLQARKTPCLVYSMHETAHHVQSAFKAGALGYVSKREACEVLIKAIREVVAGRRFVSPNAALALLKSQGAPRELSANEKQVYHLIGRGEGTLEIASTMKISTKTVESYYARIMEKLDLEGMHELRRHAIAHCREHTA